MTNSKFHFTASGFAYGIDIHQYIIDFANENIKKLTVATNVELPNLQFSKRNCFVPDPEELLYDRIHVGACCPESYLTHLYALLKPGGIIVTPFGDRLLKATKQPDGTVSEETLMQVRYSDLILPSDAEVQQAKKECARVRARRIRVPSGTLTSEQRATLAEKFANRGGNGGEGASDVFFLVDGTKIPAHKSVISSRRFVYNFSRKFRSQNSDSNCFRVYSNSEVFKAMLSNGMRESQADVIKLEGVEDVSAFLELLRFCYTDECDITDDNVVTLLELANYYKFDRLVAQCELKLRRFSRLLTGSMRSS
jgi:hypothetical protein